MEKPIRMGQGYCPRCFRVIEGNFCQHCAEEAYKNFQPPIDDKPTNIMFENAKFGDRFKTRGGKMAIYIKYVNDILKPNILLVDGDGEIACSNEGLIWVKHPDIEVSNDIVGRWEE